MDELHYNPDTKMNHIDSTGWEADEHFNKIDKEGPLNIRCFGCIESQPIETLVIIGHEYYCLKCL